MKKLLLSSVALIGLTVGATAADLPRAPAPYVPVAPAFTWTGFYIGVNAGYGWSNRNDDPCLDGAFGFVGFGTCSGANLSSLTVPSSPAGALVPVGPVFAPTLNNFSFFRQDNRRDGFVGGGQIGYNYQFTPGSGLVIG